MERTLAIIKPDAVGSRLSGRIIQRIEDAGFQIRAMRMLRLSPREAEGFYAVHRERPHRRGASAEAGQRRRMANSSVSSTLSRIDVTSGK